MSKNKSLWDQVNKHSDDIKELYKEKKNPSKKENITLVISIVSLFIVMFNFWVFYTSFNVKITSVMDLDSEDPYFKLYNEGDKKMSYFDKKIYINTAIEYTIYDEDEYKTNKEEASEKSSGNLLINVEPEFYYSFETGETTKEFLRYKLSNTLRYTQDVRAYSEVVSINNETYVFKAKGIALFGEVSYQTKRFLINDSKNSVILKNDPTYSEFPFTKHQLSYLLDEVFPPIYPISLKDTNNEDGSAYYSTLKKLSEFVKKEGNSDELEYAGSLVERVYDDSYYN